MNQEETINEIEDIKKIDDEIEQLEKNMDEIHKANMETLESIKHEKSINKTIEKLNELAERNPDKPRTNAHIRMMTECMTNSITLDVLFETLERTSKEKLVRIYNTNFDKEIKNLRKKLNKSTYHFTDVNLLLEQLSKVLSEDDAKLFIFSICRLVNSQGKYFINGAALFVSQLLKNILLVNSKEFPEREYFIDNIHKYINEVRG